MCFIIKCSTWHNYCHDNYDDNMSRIHVAPCPDTDTRTLSFISQEELDTESVQLQQFAVSQWINEQTECLLSMCCVYNVMSAIMQCMVILSSSLALLPHFPGLPWWIFFFKKHSGENKIGRKWINIWGTRNCLVCLLYFQWPPNLGLDCWAESRVERLELSAAVVWVH